MPCALVARTCTRRWPPSAATATTGALLALAFSVGLGSNALSPSLTAAAADLGVPADRKDYVLGGLTSASFWLLGAPLSLLVGLHVDRPSARRKPLAVAVGLATAAVMVGVACVRTVPWLLALRAAHGALFGALQPLCFSVVADLYPPASRPVVASYVGLAVGGGIALGSLAAGATPQLGWRAPFVAAAVVCALAAAVVARVAVEPVRGLHDDDDGDGGKCRASPPVRSETLAACQQAGGGGGSSGGSGGGGAVHGRKVAATPAAAASPAGLATVHHPATTTTTTTTTTGAASPPLPGRRLARGGRTEVTAAAAARAPPREVWSGSPAAAAAPYSCSPERLARLQAAPCAAPADDAAWRRLPNDGSEPMHAGREAVGAPPPLRPPTPPSRHQLLGRSVMGALKWGAAELRTVLTVRTNLVILAQSLAGTAGWSVATVFLTDFLRTDKGLSAQAAALVTLSFGVGAVVGGIGGGAAGAVVYRRLGAAAQPAVFGTLQILTCAPVIALLHAPPTGAASGPRPPWPPALLYATASLAGLLAAMAGPNLRSMLMNVNRHARGSAITLAFVADSIAKGVAPTVVGAVVAHTGQRLGPFTAAASGWALSGTIILLACGTVTADEAAAAATAAAAAADDEPQQQQQQRGGQHAARASARATVPSPSAADGAPLVELASFPLAAAPGAALHSPRYHSPSRSDVISTPLLTLRARAAGEQAAASVEECAR